MESTTQNLKDSRERLMDFEWMLDCVVLSIGQPTAVTGYIQSRM
jgi:hypothetical protein